MAYDVMRTASGLLRATAVLTEERAIVGGGRVLSTLCMGLLPLLVEAFDGYSSTVLCIN